MLSEPGGGQKVDLQRDVEVLMLDFLLPGIKAEGFFGKILGKVVESYCSPSCLAAQAWVLLERWLLPHWVSTIQQTHHGSPGIAGQVPLHRDRCLCASKGESEQVSPHVALPAAPNRFSSVL